MNFKNSGKSWDIQKKRVELHYTSIICQDLLLKNNYKTLLEIPVFDKIVLNTTSKHYGNEKKNLLPSFLALEFLTGQKVKLTVAKKSHASFKIREKQPLGCQITLRKHKMYMFFTVLNTLVLPRLRDFQGISPRSLNHKGNFSLGFTQLLLFPQLENHFEYFQNFQGLNITFETNSKKKKQNFLLYSAFQILFA